MKQSVSLFALAMVILFTSSAMAANKVVVIPLNSSKYVPGAVNTVTSAGQVWMDRNLGALRVATKSADPDAYGTLYQWGRAGDGHEYRSSSTTTTQSTSDTLTPGSFIIGFLDWRNPKNDNLWQGESGINNPCPAGFRLPTETEWETEVVSWGSNDNAAGALASPLKLVPAGYRSTAEGTLGLVGLYGYYWSSTVEVVSGRTRKLAFNSAFALANNSGNRAEGASVRCLKE